MVRMLTCSAVGKTMTHQEAVKSWKDLAKYMHGLDKLLKQKDQQIETLQKEKAEESLRSCACNEELKRVQEENRTLKIRAEVAVRMLKTANQELDDLAVAANNVVTSDWDKIGENMKELKQAIEEWDFPGCAENA